jgi:hypothetical protein
LLHCRYLERQKAREERAAAAAAEDGTGAEATPSADTPAVEAYAAEVRHDVGRSTVFQCSWPTVSTGGCSSVVHVI